MGLDVVTLALARKNAKKQIQDAMEGAGVIAGKSAYEIAVENGYSGTEEQWLESLHGTKGDKGDPGETPDLTEIENAIGDLSNLSTSEKSSLVAAINELVGQGGGGHSPSIIATDEEIENTIENLDDL
jgi:hypothetical protein